MLERIVDIIKKTSNVEIISGTLFCYNYTLTDLECIEYLEQESVLENSLYSKDINSLINLELSLPRLNSLGYYEKFDAFVSKNKYVEPTIQYYIDELNCYNIDIHEVLTKYRSIIKFISALIKISKHNYNDIDVEIAILFREDKSVFLSFIYDSILVSSIDINDIEKLNTISQVLEESDTEKKLLFINELIEFLSSQEEISRFSSLLSSYVEFYEKCNNAYQFYLRNYSYNKLKLELDSKALEYTQKIQSVINESQTKLIAIPTAFVLVGVAFDFTDLFAVKNFVTFLSLIIFGVLIDLFISNQKSTLNFINDNIKSYRDSFKENNIEQISSKFLLVNVELEKQKSRLVITQIILWFIPSLLFCVWFFFINYEILSVAILILICLIFLEIYQSK